MPLLSLSERDKMLPRLVLLHHVSVSFVAVYSVETGSEAQLDAKTRSLSYEFQVSLIMLAFILRISRSPFQVMMKRQLMNAPTPSSLSLYLQHVLV